MSRKISIDHDLCISCAACYAICPEVYCPGEGGVAILSKKYRTNGDNEGEISTGAEDCAMRGADSCPVEAIVLG